MADEPVFVCGMARSGTTWLAQSLGQSPELTYVQETWLLERLEELADWFEVMHDEWGGWTPWNRRGIDRPAFVESLGGWYRGLLDEAAEGQRFVEKTPDWNALHLPFLMELFPDAYYVLIYRDGRNCVASVEAERRRKGVKVKFHRACANWAQSMDLFAALRAEDGGRRVAFVRYEDLLDDFDANFERVCEFVGIAPFRPEPHTPNTAFPDGGGDFNDRWSSWSYRRRRAFDRLAGRQLAEWGYVT